MNGKSDKLDESSERPYPLAPLPDFGEREVWSLALVESGLRAADLAPLASHLRSGFPIPRSLADKIADALEGSPDALCKITAKRSKAGRTHDRSKHARHVEIAWAAYRRLSGMQRGDYDAHISEVAVQFGVSKTTVESALRDFSEQVRKWESTIP